MGIQERLTAINNIKGLQHRLGDIEASLETDNTIDPATMDLLDKIVPVIRRRLTVAERASNVDHDEVEFLRKLIAGSEYRLMMVT